jgi:transcriptional regulator of heat shock response
MNDRQRKLLAILVEEYIKSAEPISSGYLAHAYALGVSPATIRNDLAALLEQGYLKKMYFSSGNVPTNLAYRFFVDEVANKDRVKADRQPQHLPRLQSLEQIAEFLSARSRLLSLVMNEDMDMALDGINYLFSQPDFSSLEMMQGLAGFIDSLLDTRKELFTELAHQGEAIFIGEENPLFPRQTDIACLVGSCDDFQNKKLAMFLVGPTRMPYQRNAMLIHNLLEYFSK